MNPQIYNDILEALALIQDYTTSPENRQIAENALIEFRKQPDAVTYIGAILTQEGGCMFYFLGLIVGPNAFVRHYSLNSLKSIIITQWNTSNNDQRTYVRNLAIECMKQMANVNILVIYYRRIHHKSVTFLPSLRRCTLSLSNDSGLNIGRICFQSCEAL